MRLGEPKLPEGMSAEASIELRNLPLEAPQEASAAARTHTAKEEGKQAPEGSALGG